MVSHMRQIGEIGVPAKQPLGLFFCPVKVLLRIKTFCIKAHTSDTCINENLLSSVNKSSIIATVKLLLSYKSSSSLIPALHHLFLLGQEKKSFENSRHICLNYAVGPHVNLFGIFSQTLAVIHCHALQGLRHAWGKW